MAMTVRLDPELDRRLSEVAEAEHSSKHQLLIRAVEEFLTRRGRMARTLANADAVIAENTGLLDRLSR